jgi:membrane-associated protease RseP (regulator of RpoE activity)
LENDGQSRPCAEITSFPFNFTQQAARGQPNLHRRFRETAGKLPPDAGRRRVLVMKSCGPQLNARGERDDRAFDLKHNGSRFMKRSLGLFGVGLLALVLTASLVFGGVRSQHAASTNGSAKTSFVSAKSGKKKGGKKKPGKKSGKKKHKHHHRHHRKHHHRHHDHDRDRDRDRDHDRDRDYDRDYDRDWDHVSLIALPVNGLSGQAVGTTNVLVADDKPDAEVDGDKGLLITEVVDGGPAEEAGLDVDDTILSVNGVRVQSVEELNAAVKKATGAVVVVFISDDSGDVEEVDITPKNGKLGLSTEVVELEDAD